MSEIRDNLMVDGRLEIENSCALFFPPTKIHIKDMMCFLRPTRPKEKYMFIYCRIALYLHTFSPKKIRVKMCFFFVMKKSFNLDLKRGKSEANLRHRHKAFFGLQWIDGWMDELTD